MESADSSQEQGHALPNSTSSLSEPLPTSNSASSPSPAADTIKNESAIGSLPLGGECSKGEAREGGLSQELDEGEGSRTEAAVVTVQPTVDDSYASHGVEDLAKALSGFTLANSRGGDAREVSGPTEEPLSSNSHPAGSAQPLARAIGTETSSNDDTLGSTTLQDQSTSAAREVAEEREEEWHLKSIAWPPLPPRPTETGNSRGFETSELRVKIIQQNRNGPCSLIALCNVLILRNDLHIAPGRDRVTYSYLSALLADYFLRITSLPSAPPSPAFVETPTVTSSRQLSLEAALSILPQTRYGLNLNPQFLRIDGFTTSPSSGQGELALFSLAQIPLLHGWIADSGDRETYEVLEEAKDYDRAIEMVVEGSEVAGKLGLEGQGGVDLDEEELLREAERRSRWTREEEDKVRKAHLINRFLNSTSTQLTYPGLFALSSSPSLLPPSGLAALFRNSHLSVIYRRPRTPTLDSSEPRPTGPELFTLVTDSSFAGEDEVVWESIEDVDGSASEFFTAGLTKSHARGGDFAGLKNVRDLPREGTRRGEGERGDNSELADLALAQQLQAEEEHRAEAYERAEQRRYEEEAQARHVASPPSGSTTLNQTRHAVDGRGRRNQAVGGGPGTSAKPSKAEKDKCLVM